MRVFHLGLVTVALAFAGCDAINDAVDSIDDIGNDADVYYYVSLGTSLSVGVRPNGSGVLLPTDDGYSEQLFDQIRPGFEAGAPNRELRLVKLGCPGETLDDMISGGSCPYLAGSQLDAVVDFLEDNADKVYLLTIDIGGNDFRNANCITDAVDFDCVNTVSAQAAVVFNDSLGTTYGTAGISIADVYLAFESDDFATMVPTSLPSPNDVLPISVANICSLTYMCEAPPVGPDIHANVAGYSLIATTMETVLP